MPTYDYKCESCEAELELMQSIKQEPTKTCPTCGKETLKRLITGGTFVLKGDGWARDLYSKKM